MIEPKQTLRQLLRRTPTNADMVYFSNRLSHLVEHFGRVGDTKVFANFYCPIRVEHTLREGIREVEDAHAKAHGGFMKVSLRRKKERMVELLNTIVPTPDSP